jgi:hypothetical protein
MFSRRGREGACASSADISAPCRAWRQKVGKGLFAALEFSAPDDHGLYVPGERRHGAEWKVAAIAVGVNAGAAHTAFGLVGHGAISFTQSANPASTGWMFFSSAQPANPMKPSVLKVTASRLSK